MCLLLLHFKVFFENFLMLGSEKFNLVENLNVIYCDRCAFKWVADTSVLAIRFINKNCSGFYDVGGYESL